MPQIIGQQTLNRIKNGRINVAKYVRYTALVFMMLISACKDSSSVDDEFHKNKMIENMKLSSLWIVKEGVSVFFRDGKNGLHRKLVDEWGVQIWVDPWVETDRYLAQFRIKARGINYDIHNLHRETVGGDYYEFWLIKVAAKPWSGEVNRSVFLITKTKEIYGAREIVKQSNQFLGKYQVEEGEEITLPVDDLELLYDMQAWLFPENYRNSDLKDRKVVMDSDGRITLESE